jgi:hypothetical protein
MARTSNGLKALTEFVQHLNNAQCLHRVPTVRSAPRSSHPGSVLEAVDHFVISLGYSALGESWFRLDEAEAQRELATRLQTSLAYGVKMLSRVESDALSVQFLAVFDQGDATFLSNWSNNSWTPITRSTIEAAYVGIDDATIALVLFEDED